MFGLLTRPAVATNPCPASPRPPLGLLSLLFAAIQQGSAGLLCTVHRRQEQNRTRLNPRAVFFSSRADLAAATLTACFFLLLPTAAAHSSQRLTHLCNSLVPSSDAEQI